MRNPTKMLTFNLSTHKKARIWTNATTSFNYDVIDVITSVVQAENQRVINQHDVAVEFYVPNGPRSLYGLLGASFSPDNDERLTIKVNISTPEGAGYEESLAKNVDEVYVGLPSEYANSVLMGASEAVETSGIGFGTLSFHCGAHGVVGSSRMFFRLLAKIVVKLMTIEPSSMDRDIVHILEDWRSLT